MKVLFTQKGDKKGDLTLPKEIFEVPFNEDLVHRALVMQMANARVAIAHTKSRGDVRGGGRKPFRQKGTGNARQGTIRAPHMRGGSVVFGPTKYRNFSKSMPKKERRRALFSALSAKATAKEISALENYSVETPKTKDFVDLIKKIGVERSALIVMDEKNQGLIKSASNIPGVKTILVNYLNIRDLQKYNNVIFLEKAVDKLKEVFLSK